MTAALRTARPVGVAVIVGVVVGVVAWGVLSAGGLRARPAYCIGLALAVAVLVALVRAISARDEIAPAAPDQTGEGSHPYSDMYFVEYRLSWGSVERTRFERRVRPLFVRLATERLRQRHAVDPDSEPDKARGIVGEQLWALMTGPETPEGKVPGPEQVAELVSAIEAI